jgi:hypothetical protein
MMITMNKPMMIHSKECMFTNVFSYSLRRLPKSPTIGNCAPCKESSLFDSAVMSLEKATLLYELHLSLVQYQIATSVLIFFTADLAGTKRCTSQTFSDPPPSPATVV